MSAPVAAAPATRPGDTAGVAAATVRSRTGGPAVPGVDTAATVPVGVAALVDAAVDAVFAVVAARAVADGAVNTHVPAGETGSGSGPVCESYRNPAASPSASVTLDAPTADVLHGPPPRDTNSTQNGLDDVQHDGGYAAGSLSIWQIAAPSDPNPDVPTSSVLA